LPSPLLLSVSMVLAIASTGKCWQNYEYCNFTVLFNHNLTNSSHDLTSHLNSHRISVRTNRRSTDPRLRTASRTSSNWIAQFFISHLRSNFEGGSGNWGGW
jgi:hypothetical protein